jgi:8-oxo-dGTP pyrophosphatase MutT (NUDIX family)
MSKITVTFINPEDAPLAEQVSAVFVVAFEKGKILAIENERGWDIPGGHLDSGEDLLTGLRREFDEEAGAKLTMDAVPYAVLMVEGVAKKMLFFVAQSFQLGKLIYSDDVLGREIMTKEELLNRYYGDKKLLKQLLDEAEKIQ